MTYLRQGDSTGIEEAATKLRSFTTKDQSLAADKIAAELFPDRKPDTITPEWVDCVSKVCATIKQNWPL